jgi:hypothetical protein
MFKKIICVGIVMVMCVTLFSACGYLEMRKKSTTNIVGDFSLTISVEKRKISAGEKIKVTAELRNLSGEDIPIKTPKPEIERLEDLFFPGLYPEGLDIGYSFKPFEPSHELVIEKGAVIRSTMEVCPEEWEERWEYRFQLRPRCRVGVRVHFYIDDQQEIPFRIHSASLNVTIK